MIADCKRNNERTEYIFESRRNSSRSIQFYSYSIFIQWWRIRKTKVRHGYHFHLSLSRFALTLVLILCRYAKELATTRLSSVRKSVVFGIYLGWEYFIINIVYAAGFIFGLLLMHQVGHNNLNLTKLIIVSFSLLKISCAKYLISLNMNRL